jgi:hypothetical protein
VDFSGWSGDGAQVGAGPDRIAVDYRLTGNRVVLRPRPAARTAAGLHRSGTAAAASGGLLHASAWAATRP